MKGSQNGLDNSGTTGNMEWVYTVSEGGSAKYLHWDIRGKKSPELRRTALNCIRFHVTLLITFVIDL